MCTDACVHWTAAPAKRWPLGGGGVPNGNVPLAQLFVQKGQAVGGIHLPIDHLIQQIVHGKGSFECGNKPCAVRPAAHSNSPEHALRHRSMFANTRKGMVQKGVRHQAVFQPSTREQPRKHEGLKQTFSHRPPTHPVHVWSKHALHSIVHMLPRMPTNTTRQM